MQGARRGSGVGSIAVLSTVLISLASGLGIYGLSWLAAQGDRQDFTRRIYGETERVFKAAIDPRFQNKATELNRVLARLVVIEAIAGGALFDDTGHLQETFGEVPETSFSDIERGGHAVFQVGDKSRVEYYFPPAVSQTRFHILARVDVSRMSGLEGEQAERRFLLSLGAALVGAIAGTAFIWIFVARPIRRILAVLTHAIADPAAVDAGERLPSGSTEIGRLGLMLERFRATFAEAWRTRVTVADAILEHALLGIVHLDPDGLPAFANARATKLLGRDVTLGSNWADLSVEDIEAGREQRLGELIAAHPATFRLVKVKDSRDEHAMFAGSLVISAHQRKPTSLVVLVEATELQRKRLGAEALARSNALSLLVSRRHELELKLTLESCLTLMAGPGKGADVHIDALPYAQSWLEAAQAAGLVSSFHMANTEGPTLEGSAEDLSAVMRLALLVCYARGKSVPVTMMVDARGINFETAGVTIRTQPVEKASSPEAPIADWQLAFAALRTALRRVNGQLSEFEANDDGTMIRLVLRGAAERMSTIKAER